MKLRKTRDDLGLTREQLAEASGTSTRYVASLELNKQRSPSASVLYRVSKVLGVSMESLLITDKADSKG
jgi:transcriptional regulator with XRE-family HTH domain